MDGMGVTPRRCVVAGGEEETAEMRSEAETNGAPTSGGGDGGGGGGGGEGETSTTTTTTTTKTTTTAFSAVTGQNVYDYENESEKRTAEAEELHHHHHASVHSEDEDDDRISSAMTTNLMSTGAVAVSSQTATAETTQIPTNTNTAAIVRVGASKRYTDKDLLGDIFRMGVPCLGVALADPLMSLIDTGCVGRVSTLGLAALGPNTAIFNTVFQVCVFWGTATTNFIAGASPTAAGISVDERSRRREKGAELLSSALSMALIKGLVLWAVLYMNGESLLRLMGADDELVGPALSYYNVRVAAVPAVLVTMVAQGACMGQQDAVSPLIVVLISALANLIGDFQLVINNNLGVQGAAIATIAAQYLQAVVFLIILFVRGKLDKVSAIPLKWCGLPKMRIIARFAEVASVLASRTILQMSAYGILTFSVLTLGDYRFTASHQVALQIFWLMSYFPEPLSVCAQAFIAKDISMPLKVHRTSWLLMKIGLVMGVSIFAVSYSVATFFCGAFSTDPGIVELASQLGVQIGLAASLVSVALVLDGILIGSSDFGLMPAIGALSTGAVFVMLRFCMERNVGLNGMWWSLPIFFGCRVLLNVLKVVLGIGRRKSPLLKPPTSPGPMVASYQGMSS